MSNAETNEPGRGIPSDTFAIRLVVARAWRGMNAAEAARQCEIAPATWATWEHGARPRGMDDVVRKIAAGLDVDRGWLMFGGPLSGPGQPEAPNRCTESEQLALPLVA